MLIDGHAHLFDTSRTAQEDLVRFMEDNRIDRTFISTLGAGNIIKPTKEEIISFNNTTYSAMQAYPDKISGYSYVNPLLDGALDLLKADIEDRGFSGVKLWMSTLCDDEAVFPIVEQAIEYNIPVLIHTFFLRSGQQPTESASANVAALAARYGEAKLIMAHLGGNPFEAIRRIKDFPNVYTDFAGTFFGAGELEYAINHLGAERIIFGTDYPISSVHVCAGQVEDLKLTDDEKQCIYSENMLNLADRSFYIGDKRDKRRDTEPPEFERAAEHIDINAYFGEPLDYYKDKPKFGDEDRFLRYHKKSGARELMVSFADSILNQDAFASDDRRFDDSVTRRVATLNPTESSLKNDLYYYIAEYNIKAVKIFPGLHGYRLTDKRVYDLCSELESNGLVLMVALRLGDERQSFVIKPGSIEIEEIREFLKNAPCKVVLLTPRAWELDALKEFFTEDEPRVFADISGLKNGPYPLESALNAVSAKTLLYGSASPFYAKRSTLFMVANSTVDEDVKADILYKNAKELFSL